MRLFVLTVIILLIVFVPMLILIIWFTFEFDSYRPAGGYYAASGQNQFPQYPVRPTFSFPTSRWELELMDTKSGKRIHKVFQGELILGRSVGEIEPTGWLYLSEARTVSRRQCRLSNTAMGLFLENLSDVNITRLNGMPVQSPKRILPGDYISFGDNQFWVTCLQRCG